MNDSAKIPPALHKVAVMGTGAVGGFYGALLARAGHPVTLIGRPPTWPPSARRAELQMGGHRQAVRLIASTSRRAGGADLVLCCVKSTDTDAAARAMAPHLAPATVVYEPAERRRQRAHAGRAYRCRVWRRVVYVAIALPGPGVVQHFGRGDLAIGAMPGGTGPRCPSGPAAARGSGASATVPVRVGRRARASCGPSCWSTVPTTPSRRSRSIPMPLGRSGRASVHCRWLRARGRRGGAGRGVALSLPVSMAAMAHIAVGDAGAALVHRAGSGAAQAQRDRPSQRLSSGPARPLSRRCYARSQRAALHRAG